MACDICRGAEFVNVEAVKFVWREDKSVYERPDSWVLHARYCPGCGERMPEASAKLTR